MVVVTRAHVLFLAEELRHNDTERLSARAMTGHSTDAYPYYILSEPLCDEGA